jgi:hypothetical protein
MNNVHKHLGTGQQLVDPVSSLLLITHCCRWFVQQLFVSSVLFTEEATFGRHGITNFLNQYQWAERHPRGTIHASHQQHFTSNVWAGIVGECLVGPCVLPQSHTSMQTGISS